MKEFKKVNSSIEETMKTHLINDLNEFGVWEDNYDSFFEKRAEVISQEIVKRIIPQEADIINAEHNDEVASSEELLYKNPVEIEIKINEDIEKGE